MDYTRLSVRLDATALTRDLARAAAACQGMTMKRPLWTNQEIAKACFNALPSIGRVEIETDAPNLAVKVTIIGDSGRPFGGGELSPGEVHVVYRLLDDFRPIGSALTVATPRMPDGEYCYP
jgi:hypothetical protein